MADQSSGNGRDWLQSLLNHYLKVRMSDGRLLIGQFLCTDRDQNIILSGCSEYARLSPGDKNSSNVDCDEYETRQLGLVMVPGNHIDQLCVSKTFTSSSSPAQEEDSEIKEID